MSVCCAICLDSLKSADVLHGTPCGHVYHCECISNWLDRSKSCPQCRLTVNDGEMKRTFLVFTEKENRIEYYCKTIKKLGAKITDLEERLRESEWQRQEEVKTLKAQLADIKSKMELQSAKRKKEAECAENKTVAPTVNKKRGRPPGSRASRAPLSTIADENQKSAQSRYNLRPR